MSDVKLFAALAALMGDKESIEIKVQKTGDELTVLAAPKMNGKTALLTLSGTAEDLDEGFVNELTKPVEKIKGLKSNAETVEVTDLDEDDDQENESGSSSSGKGSKAKKDTKKPEGKRKYTRSADKAAEKDKD